MPKTFTWKCQLTIRLLEVLHTQPEVWMVYKKLCLPAQIQTTITMTAEELKDFIKRMPLSMTSEEFSRWRTCRNKDQETFNTLLPVLETIVHLVNRVVIPDAKIEPAEITWALTVAQTRATRTGEGGRCSLRSSAC